MTEPETTALVESYVHVRPRGPAELLPKGGIGVVREGETTIVWDPEVAGVLVSEAHLTESSAHHGERHLDGDEVVYLISGVAGVAVEDGDGQIKEMTLQPGRAVVVPQGVWHRLLVDEPSRLLFLNSGRTEVRPP